MNRKLSFSADLTLVFLFLIFNLFFYLGLDHLEKRHQEMILQQFSQNSTSLFEAWNYYYDDEEYWCHILFKHFNEARNSEQFLEMLRTQRSLSGESLTAIIWNASGKVHFNDHFLSVSPNVLEEMFEDLGRVTDSGKNLSRKDITRLRKHLGPQVSWSRLAKMLDFNAKELMRPDTSSRFLAFWAGRNDIHTTLVFFDLKRMKKNIGLRRLKPVAEQNGFQFSFSGKAQYDKRIDALVNLLEAEGRGAGIFADKLFAGRRIGGDRLVALQKPYNRLVHPGKFSLLSAVLVLWLLLLIRQNNFVFFFRYYSIKWQLTLIMLVTTGLPLFTLAFIASDHLVQKRNTLIQKAYQTCISFIQHVDRSSLLNNAYLLHRVDKAIEVLRKKLPRDFGKPAISKELRKQLRENFQDMRLVASNPVVVMTDFGVLKNNRMQLFREKDQDKLQKKILVEIKMFRDIASYYLSVINRMPLELEKMTESEIIAEMGYQRPFHEIIQNMMLATDKILFLGWGEKPFPIMVKLISLRDDHITDYFLAVVLQTFLLHRDFIRRQIENIERNPYGLTFIYGNQRYFSRFKAEFISDSWYAEMARKTSSHPSVEPGFTIIDGKEYVFAGILPTNLDSFFLFAFYPLEKIDEQLDEEKRFLLTAAIVALCMIVGLALVFSSSFVLPLASLQAGAIAIRRRDFNFRLAAFADDEFGEMAKIFNRSIADFEELSLAGLVQNRLFPRQSFSESAFSLFGKSIPMAELGGDYYDYFKIDSTRFAILAGDVAGHGVGASLIMAMAKAAIIHCSDCYNNPAEILQRMHQMICETRTRAQRKIMTFQYASFCRKTGEIIYSNAGACSPILVDVNTGSIAEIHHSAPVLGGFKKSKFSNVNFKLDCGQALVFYTDGIVEALNESGEEIGYENLKKMILKSFDSDAVKFYDNLYREYCCWIGKNTAQDDLTLIILVRR